MPNGIVEKYGTRSEGRRSSDYNQDWCNERHNKIDQKLAEIWGSEHGGIKAIWNKVDGLNQKLWALLIGQIAILGGIMVIFIKEVI